MQVNQTHLIWVLFVSWKDLHVQSSSIKFYNNAQTQVGQISVDSTGLKVSSPDGGLSIYSGSTFHGEISSSNDLMVMRTEKQ